MPEAVPQLGSISRDLSRATSGDSAARDRVLARCYAKLRSFARQWPWFRFPHISAEDLIQEAMLRFLAGLEKHRFLALRNRRDLWFLLERSLRDSHRDLLRKELAKKRGAGRVPNETDLAAANTSAGAAEGIYTSAASHNPSPPEEAAATEFEACLLAELDSRQRDIITLALGGRKNCAIARELGVSPSTVRREFQALRPKCAKAAKRFFTSDEWQVVLRQFPRAVSATVAEPARSADVPREEPGVSAEGNT